MPDRKLRVSGGFYSNASFLFVAALIYKCGRGSGAVYSL